MKNTRRADPIAAVALLDEPTRRRLYEFVVARDAVGRDAAAAALGISRELAAFHLDRLVEGGLLKTTFRRLTGRSGPGAGRPAKLYSRSDREFSVALPARHYEVTTEAFAEGLERLAATVGGELVARAVNEPAGRSGLETGTSARRAAGPRPSVRRNREVLVGQLAERGFEPAIDPSSGTVTLANCPYRAASASHRDLTCGMNLAWAQGLMEGLGDAGVTPRLDPSPDRCCVVFSPHG